MDEDFIAWLRAVDEDYVGQGVPIPQRPMRAWGELAKRLKIPIRLMSPKMIPPDFPQPGDREVLLLYEWYDQQYGKRLAMGAALGEVALMLRGDAWIASLPIVYGTCTFYSSRLSGEDPVLATRPNRLRHNVVNCIVDLPPQMRSTLTDDELLQLLRVFTMAFESFSAMENKKLDPLIRAARTDHAATVRHIVKRPRHFGQARWSALQAVEKCLKAFLVSRSQTPPKSHDLARLSQLAIACGLQGVDVQGIRAIQVAADIRYGADTSSLAEAVRSHHLSIGASGNAAAALPAATV